MSAETYSHEGPKCPYCGRQYTADEPHYYRDDYEEEDCGDCGKTFRVEVYHSVSWTCETIDEPEALAARQNRAGETT